MGVGILGKRDPPRLSMAGIVLRSSVACDLRPPAVPIAFASSALFLTRSAVSFAACENEMESTTPVRTGVHGQSRSRGAERSISSRRARNSSVAC